MRNQKIPFLRKLVLQGVNAADNEPFSFSAKMFVTSEAAYLSRNIYSRKVSLQKQGLHHSEDLNCNYENFDRDSSTGCSYPLDLLVGLPLSHSFIAKNLIYCHRAISRRRTIQKHKHA